MHARMCVFLCTATAGEGIRVKFRFELKTRAAVRKIKTKNKNAIGGNPETLHHATCDVKLITR